MDDAVINEEIEIQIIFEVRKLKYIENKFILKTVTEDLLENVLKIYDTNEEYFKKGDG